MTTKAFVLIKTTGLRPEEVAENLNRIEGVKLVYAVTFPYDFIAGIEGDSLKHVRDLVATKIMSIPNICRTNTCVCIDRPFLNSASESAEQKEYCS